MYTYLDCEKCTSSLEQGEVSLAECFSDIPASVLSKLNLTAGESCSNGSETESCQPSQSGTMCEPSMDDHGEARLMSSVGDSLVRTSAQPERAPGLPASEAGSGKSSSGSYAKWDPASYLWRTHQYSLAGDLEPFLETWPRWGMMRAGECYPLPMPSGLMALRAWITSASASGLSLPTPCVPNGGRSVAHAEQRGKSFYHNGKKVQLDLGQAVRRLPTLHGFSKDGKSNGPSGNELGRAVNRMPSPTSSMMTMADMEQAKFAGDDSRRPTYQQAKRLPTVRSASKTGGGIGLDGGTGAREMITEALGDQAAKDLTGGSLNPEWVDWLQGFPIGWTDLQPLAIPKFQQWLDSHGDY